MWQRIVEQHVDDERADRSPRHDDPTTDHDHRRTDE
jgi:hypothetical protein